MGNLPTGMQRLTPLEEVVQSSMVAALNHFHGWGGDCVCNLSVSDTGAVLDSWELVSVTDSSMEEVVPGGSLFLEPEGSESRIADGAMATMMVKIGCC